MVLGLVLALLNPAPATIRVHAPQAEEVKIAGDAWGWEGQPMTEAPGGWWTTRFQAEPDARIEYKFIVDGVWQLDPRAPRTPNGLGGENSVWSGPAYRATAPTDERALLQWGVSRTELVSAKGYRYKVVIARPAGVKADSPVMIYHDGAGYENYVRALAQAANLVAQGQVRKFVLVLVESSDRTRDYWNDPKSYVEFVMNRLLPYVRQQTGVVARPADTGTGGASLGGVISLRLASETKAFGMAHVQSPALWVSPSLLTTSTYSGVTLKVALCSGIYERIDMVALRNALPPGSVRHDVTRPEGHTWSLWRETFAPGLVSLLGGP